MKRNFFRFLFFLACLSILFGIRYLHNDAPKNIASIITKTAKDNSILLQIKESKLLSPRTISFQQIGAQYTAPKMLLVLSIDRVELTLQIIKTLFFNPSVSFAGEAYSGTFEGSADYSSLSKKQNLDLHIEHFDLAKHAVIAGFGINGLMSLRTKLESSTRSDSTKGIPESGEFSLNVRNGAFAPTGMVRAYVPVSKISDIEAQIVGSMSDGFVAFSKINLTSSAGSADGKGTLAFNNYGKILKGRFSINLSLSNEGLKAFGSYLALAAKRSLNETINKWQIVIQLKEGQRTEFDVTPVL